jgi:uncharacterized tellurite resistance protein B-like protein
VWHDPDRLRRGSLAGDPAAAALCSVFPATRRSPIRGPAVHKHEGGRNTYLALENSIMTLQRPPGPASQGDAARTSSEQETETVRRIVGELESLPPADARRLAAFAYVLARAAQSDLKIDDAETGAMERIVVELGGLTEAQAVIVVETAKSQSRMLGGTEDFLVTREYREISTEDERLALLRCCFAVTASDDSVTSTENSVINEIAVELGLTRDQLNSVRAEFRDQLAAMRIVRSAQAG